MRLLLIPLLFILSMPAMASFITCYSHGHKIYSGYATEIDSDGRMILFKDAKTHKDVFILADCVIKI